jgi:hypothetical protein
MLCRILQQILQQDQQQTATHHPSQSVLVRNVNTKVMVEMFVACTIMTQL